MSRVSSAHRNSSVDMQGKLGDSPLGQVVIKRNGKDNLIAWTI